MTDFNSRLYRSVLPSIRGRPSGTMPMSLYGYVLRVSGKQQARLGLLTLLVFPLASLPLELQRQIVDRAVIGADAEPLLLLGGSYLAVLLVQCGLKLLREMYLYRIAEGVTRLLRKRFVGLELADATIDAGTKQAILSSESEKIGGFVAESISLPLLQAGTVVSIATYMLIVQPLIAAVAIAFLAPSIIVISLAQPLLNKLTGKKIVVVRALGEFVLKNGTDGPERPVDAESLIERIYALRLRFALIKNATKAFHTLISHLGLLGILLAGGWLAIQGETEIGTIVAFMSGYERMTAPARDLLNFYRRLSLMRMQYKLVLDAST